MMGSLHRPVYEWKVRQWAMTDSAFRKDETGNGSTSDLLISGEGLLN